VYQKLESMSRKIPKSLRCIIRDESFCLSQKELQRVAIILSAVAVEDDPN
jgi:hypothetical protein